MVRRARWNRRTIDSVCNKSNNLPNAGGLYKCARTCRYGYRSYREADEKLAQALSRGEAPFNPRAIPVQSYTHPAHARPPLCAFLRGFHCTYNCIIRPWGDNCKLISLFFFPLFLFPSLLREISHNVLFGYVVHSAYNNISLLFSVYFLR